MIDKFNWLIILLIFALFIFYSNSKISNTIEDYRVEKNVINNNNLDNEIGSHSIYEVGKIISIIQNHNNYPNNYT
jgi:hypothetical protein